MLGRGAEIDWQTWSAQGVGTRWATRGESRGRMAVRKLTNSRSMRGDGRGCALRFGFGLLLLPWLSGGDRLGRGGLRSGRLRRQGLWVGWRAGSGGRSSRVLRLG